MEITYRFAGFQEVEALTSEGLIDEGLILECDLTHVQSFPDYVKVKIDDTHAENGFPV